MTPRPTADQSFMLMAHGAAIRATCARRKVGAVLVVDGHIISSGYNGAPRGLDHCIDVGCEMEHNHCVRCVHAEANALLQAATAGIATKDATLYTTASPCRRCMMLIINAGIRRVAFTDEYGDQWSFDAAKKLGIDMVRVTLDPAAFRPYPATTTPPGVA